MLLLSMCGATSQLLDVSMNEEWCKNVIQEQPLPSIQAHLDDQCIFQHDGAPCHKPEIITKGLRGHDVEDKDLPISQSY